MDYNVTLDSIFSNVRLHYVTSLIQRGFNTQTAICEQWEKEHKYDNDYLYTLITCARKCLNILVQEKIIYKSGDNYHLTTEAKTLLKMNQHEFENDASERKYYEEKASKDELIFYYRMRERKAKYALKRVLLQLDDYGMK